MTHMMLILHMSGDTLSKLSADNMYSLLSFVMFCDACRGDRNSRCIEAALLLADALFLRKQPFGWHAMPNKILA